MTKKEKQIFEAYIKWEDRFGNRRRTRRELLAESYNTAVNQIVEMYRLDQTNDYTLNIRQQ